MYKSKIECLITLLIVFIMFSGCSNSSCTNLTTLSEDQKNISYIPYMDDFNATAQSVILDNGKSILQSELIYTKSGINSISEGYGNLQNTLDYTIYNNVGEIKKSNSMYISSDVSDIKLPDRIKYTDSFIGTLDALNLTEKVSNREDERYFDIKNDDTSGITVSFLSFHGEPVNTDFLKASATVCFKNNNEEKDEKGRVHKYYQGISLEFREGKLESIQYYVSDEYDTFDEQIINNKRVGIRFINPEYKGDDYKTRLEEFYYEDGKINTIYSVKTNTAIEIKVSYEGWQSADNGILFENLTHKVNGEKRFSDSINEPYADSYKPSWYQNLYKDYLFYVINLPYNYFEVVFSKGEINIYRNTSR